MPVLDLNLMQTEADFAAIIRLFVADQYGKLHVTEAQLLKDPNLKHMVVTYPGEEDARNKRTP